MTIPTTTLVFITISGLLAFVLPICLAVYYRKKSGANISPFFIGCAIFILFVFVLEGAVNSTILQSGVGSKIMGNIFLYGAFGGLMAGLFEETGRLVAFKFISRKTIEPANALMYGAGHGGIEAILLVGINYLTYAAVLILSAFGALSIMGDVGNQLLSTMLPVLGSTSPEMFLIAGFERILAITTHISLSVLVFVAVTQSKMIFYPLAILMHAAVNMAAVVSMQYFGVYAAEGATLVLTLIYAYVAYRVYTRAKNNVRRSVVRL